MVRLGHEQEVLMHFPSWSCPVLDLGGSAVSNSTVRCLHLHKVSVLLTLASLKPLSGMFHGLSGLEHICIAELVVP